MYVTYWIVLYLCKINMEITSKAKTLDSLNKEIEIRIYNKVIESPEIFWLIENHSNGMVTGETNRLSLLELNINNFMQRYNILIRVQNVGKKLDILLKEFIIPNIIKNYNIAWNLNKAVDKAIKNEWNIILLIILKYILEDYWNDYPLWTKTKEDLAKTLVSSNRKIPINPLIETDYITYDYYNREINFFQDSIDKITNKIESIFEKHKISI